uniref:uncharacterized protein LOC109963902 isoform X9 n=1 Tax=Monopterus albus TaxID=43700 RepID=UPI0009B3CA81|nr:uncharacterized protein LOC109963902 isoform X9 [Monopterus albus]
MEHYSLRCQVCCSTFTAVSLLKKHVWSGMHRLKMKEIFQNDTFKPYGFIPSIVIIEGTGKTKQPMLGLSLLTLCFSPGTSTQVYLCHVCEEMCPSNKIVWHLSSGDHYSNYFSYTNPNEMSFSWMPGMKFRAILRSQINKELEERGSGSLQILHLPENLLLKLERSTYAQVMNTLSENDKLLKYLEAGKPKMTMIQTYQRDSNRKHPLVGMQHIVECICTGSPEKRHYLCTLCNLTFAWCMIIKHVLSFDHIHCYFKVWHPSTLVSRESYRDYTNNFVYKIQNLAKQSEEIHGTVNTDMKQVILKPAEFTSVNISSYAEAFEKLKSITKEDKEHLIPNIVPGIQLVLKKPNSIKEENKESSLMTNAAPVITPVTKKPDSIKEENKESSLMTNTIPVITPVTKKPDSIKEENKESSLMKNTIPVITPVTKKPDSIKEENKESSLMKNTTPVITPVTKKPDSIKEENKESSLMKNATPVITPEHTTEDVASLYKLRCQNCSVIFKTLSQYLIHLSNYEHKQMLERVECQNINADKANRANDSNWTGRKPYLYLYAYVKNRAKRNQLVVGAPLVVTCLSSQRAAIYICFACEECFPNSCLALHFESHKHLIKTLLYLNPWRLPFGWENHLDVEGLMSVALEEEKKIEPNQTSLKVFDIPLRIFLSPPFNYQKVMDQLSLCHTFLKSEVPYSKLEQTDRFPLLGNQFLVTHTACDSQLESRQVGYLCLLCRKRLMNSESYAHVFSREHVERFLNCVHPGSLDSSTDTETLLDLAKQAAHIHSISHVQHVELATHIWEPCGYIKAKRIVAAAKRRSGQGPLEPNIKPKMALFPRKTLEQVVKSNVGHNSQNDSRKTESGENKTSQISRDNSETLLKKISVVGAEIANKHSVKSEENAEKDVNKKAPKPSENKLDKERDGTGRERSKSSKDVLTQVKNYMSKDNVTKGPNTMCEKSLEDTHSGGLKQVTTTAKETSGKPSHKTVNNEAPFHVSHQKETDLWQYIKKDDRDPVVGLSSLFECHCGQHDPIYLCECCHLMIPENNIIEHLIGFHHQKMYLVLQNFPLPTWMDKSHEVKCLAASFEKNKGYGEAQVIDMDEENYNIILKQNFDSAIQTVKMLQAQQNSAYELTFNSSLSGVQPVDISATLHTETEACFVMDDIQVVDMVIDNDSEDSKIQPSPVTAAVSVITETTSKTTESTEDVKRTHITVPESRGNADSHLPVFRSSEDASNLHVFRGGANTTSLQPDSTRSNFNDKIAPTTMVEPLKMEMVRPSQTAATSDSPVTTPTESMTPISKYTARSSNCTPDTTKSTAVSELLSPTSSLTTVASSYTLATTKLRENAYKSIETTSGASSTNRLPAANPSSSTTATNAPSTFNSTITNTKLPATAPTYAASASKNKAASTKPTGSTSSTTISNTASATKSASASVLKPQEGSTGAASKYTATSHKAALTSQTGSMAVCEATRRTAPSSKIENNSKNSEMSGKTVTLEANADVAPHVHKSKPPAAPPVTRATPVLSEQKSSPKESSPTSMTKMEPNKGLAIVGRDHVILLHCGKSQQSYCDLCSVRMESSSHLSSVKHCRNFMKMKDPEWTQKESSLAKRVAFWAEVEKARPSRAQEKEVLNRDKYNYLASLQVAAALKIIKELPRYSGQAITSDISGPLDDRESTKSESTGTLVQNPATWQETLENRQQEKSDAGTCLSPRGTSGSLSMQTQLRPAVSQCQSLIPKLQVKQAEVHSKSPASSTASPKTTQTPSVSPTDYIDKLLPTRKRPTVTSVKTQVKSCTGNPQLSPPLAKCARSSPQPVSQPSPVSASEFTFVYPTVTSRLLPPEDNNTGQGFDNPMLLGLIDLVKEVKNNIETSTTSANKSSENGVDQRWDSLCVKTEMENGNSECPLLKAIVKQNRPPTKSLEEMVSVAPPVVFKNQHTTPNSNSDLSATNSSVEDFSLKGNILFKATEAKAVGNTLPPASTADPSDLQHQRGVDTQGVLANMNKLKASPISYAANNNIPGQVPQPEGSDSAAVCQLPIKPIITPRPDFTTKKLMGGCKVQDNTCPTRDDQVSHFLPAVGAANPIDTLAARGGYGQYSQMSYVTHGFSGPPAVASYIPTDNPPAYPGSLYGTRGLHSNQICPEQKALELSVPSFGYSLGTPPVPRLVCAQVQHQQPVMQQQQQQQQYSSLRSAALPAGDSNMLNVAPYLSAVSFTSPANNYGLNGYSSNSMAPTQNSSSIRLCSPYITPASFSLLSYNQQ